MRERLGQLGESRIGKLLIRHKIQDESPGDTRSEFRKANQIDKFTHY